MNDLFENMTVNLKEFGVDNGVYLDSIDIQNWGPFSGLWKINLQSKPALFVGENGTGKSSLMDGILTLLVSTGLKYNNATDSKGKATGRRKLIEYVRGFKESSSGENSSKNTTYLREKGEITIILLRFVFAERKFTVANVFMEKEGNEVDTLYVMKNGYLEAEDFPKNIDSFKAYAKALRELDATVTTDRSEYFEFVRDKMALDRNGMKLLSSLSSQKDLKDVGDVIRQYMFLERSDFRQEYEITKRNIEEMRLVINQLKEFETRDSILQKLIPLIKEGRIQQHDYSLWHGLWTKVEQYVFRCAKHTAEKELDKLKSQKFEVDTKYSNLEEAIKSAINTKATIEVNRDSKGGLEIKQKELEIENLENKKTIAQSLLNDYTGILSELGIKADCSTEFNFKKLLKKVETEKQEISNQVDIAKEAFETAKREDTNAGDILRNLEAEYRRLEQNKVAIDSRLIAVRDEVCEALGVSPSTMPFIGEYLSVEDKAWRPALEHLMHNDSKSFLVPLEYGKKVADFLNSHKRSNVTIQYRKMTKLNYTESDGAWKKISVRKDLPYAEWVQNYIKKVARHICCDTSEEFNENFPAIMKNGLIRADSQRHRVDERINIFDARNFLMSGSYVERCNALAVDIKEAKEKKALAVKEILRTNNILKESKEKMDKINSLPYIKSFVDIDVSKIDTALQECNEVLVMLKNSKDIARLDKNIEQITLKIKSIEEQKTSVFEECKNANTAVAIMEQKLLNYQNMLDTVVFSAEEETVLGELYKKRCPNSASPKFDTIMGCSSQIKRDVTTKTNELEEKKKTVCKEAERLMKWYLEVCVNLRNEMEPDMDKEGEAERFIEEYERVHDEYLPEAIKKSHDVKIMQENSVLANFIISLTHDVDESIGKIISKINDTLHSVPYSQDINPTYLDVGCKRTNDPYIKQLRKKLENAANLLGDTKNVSEWIAYCTDVMDFIGSRIDNISTRNYSKDNILDIRNWFEFPVAECRWNEDHTELYHIKELDEIAKQSGGEGVKLTYFIMAACYSMWMHLLDEDYAGRTFRFLMIDEIDTKISPSNLRDVITLFYNLGIQLISLLPVGDKVSQYEGFVEKIVCTGYIEKPASYIETISYLNYMNRNKKIVEERLKQGKEFNNV